MLITAEKNPNHTVHDCVGTQIMGLRSFDTETNEVTVELLLGKRMPADFHPGYKPILMPVQDSDVDPGYPNPVHPAPVEIAFVLPGAYAKDPAGELVK